MSGIRQLAEQLAWGLRRELALTPKPGLVDRWDNGSHPDLSYDLMQRSIDLLEDYYRAFAAGLEAGLAAAALRELGVAAEAQMLERFATNTHRGAVFLGGLLLAGRHRAGEGAIGPAVAAFAGELFADRLPAATHGARMRARYGVGGIVGEALAGLPALFQVGVPALHEAARLGLADDHGLYLTMARLMQTVQDTTALRRCGPPGLARLRRDGARLEGLLRAGADPTPFLIRANAGYRRQRLTMGGVADLLGMSAAWAAFSHQPPPLAPAADRRQPA